MNIQQRRARVGSLRKARAGMWRAWCHAGAKEARPSVFSWDFLRSVWSLLCRMTRHKGVRPDENRFAWQEHIGCTAPRSSGIYGRMI